MSFNRRRNLFTLGDFHIQQYTQQQHSKTSQLCRRQKPDPFERDPFKIQSYNFRYAEKPSFPLQNLINRVSSTSNNNRASHKRFDTFYYNHDFAPARCDKENTAPPSGGNASHTSSTSNKFHEHRRRKYLHESAQNTSTNLLGQAAANRQRCQMQTRYYNYQPNGSGSRGAISGGVSNNHSSCNATVENPSSAFAYAVPTTSPLLRSGCNQQFLQGLRAVSSGNVQGGANYTWDHQQQQQQTMNLQRNSSSHVSIASGCGQRVPPNANRGTADKDVAAAEANSAAIAPAKSGSYEFVAIVPPNARASASQYNRKSVYSTIEAKRSTCSGCQINININGLDDKQLAENLTIKIESNASTSNLHDSSSNSNNNNNNNNTKKRSSATLLNNFSTPHMSSPNVDDNLNIGQATSNHFFTIDKRLSKYALRSANERERGIDSANQLERERERERHRIRVMEIEQEREMRRKARERAQAANVAKDAVSKEPPEEVIPDWRALRERIPKMVPFKLDANLRQCLDKDDDGDLLEKTMLAVRPNNQMRRIRTVYSSGLNDLRILSNYVSKEQAAAAKAASPAAGRQKGGGGGSLSSKTKLLNTRASYSGSTSSFVSKPPPPTRKCMLDLPKITSRRSLCSRTQLPPSPPLTQHLRSQSQLCVQQPRNASATALSGSKTTLYQQSRQSPSKSRLNVNINVYADKLKLLRV